MAKKEILKPFDLEKAKAGAKLRASDGRDARIICFDRKFGGRNELIVLLTHPISKDEACFSFSEKGIYGNDFYLQIVEEVEEADRWRDKVGGTLRGYYIGLDSRILSDNCRGGYSHDCSNRNVFATEKQAQSALAMAQISQIMANDERFGGVVTTEEYKRSLTMPAIVRGIDDIDREPLIYSTCIDTDGCWQPLLFHTLKQADLFLEENMDLVKQYFML